MSVSFSIVQGFGIAITWYKCDEHDFVIIVGCLAIIFKFD